MKSLRLLPAAMLLWIFIACNVKDKNKENSGDIVTDQKNFSPAMAGTNAADTISQPGTNSNQQPSTAVKTTANGDWDKKLLKQGSLL
jgi:hypothetical protein